MKKQDDIKRKTIIGIIAAIEREAKPLVKMLKETRAEKIAKWAFWEGKFAGHNVAVSYSGCGKVLAAAHTQLMIDKYNPELIIHYGTSGAISPHLLPEDIIVGEKSIEVDYYERMVPDYPKPESFPDKKLFTLFTDKLKDNNLQFSTGTIVCNDADIIFKEDKKKLWKEYKGLCVCWEGVAVGRICNLNNVPYIQIRGISDISTDCEEAGNEFNNRVINVSTKIVEYIKYVIADINFLDINL